MFFTKLFFWFSLVAAFAAGSALVPLSAAAGEFELSGGVSYNRSTYTDQSDTWSRKWDASIAYYLTPLTSIEFSYEDSYERNYVAGLEDTTFHDKTYSVSWVQHIVGREYPVQPFFKLGIGQLDRTASGSYSNGASPPLVDNQVTEILGAGIKIYLTRTFGLRGEATTYLTNGIGSWRDNLSALAGVSIYF